MIVFLTTYLCDENLYIKWGILIKGKIYSILPTIERLLKILLIDYNENLSGLVFSI